MTAQLPSDTHIITDTGHTTDHNNIVDVLSQLTGAAPGGATTTKAAMQSITGGTPALGQILLGTAGGGTVWTQPPYVVVVPSGDSSGTNDTAALNAAFALYGSTASVQLVAGAYYVKSVTIPSNQQSLIGTGPLTVVNGVTAGPTFSWHGAAGSAPWGVTPAKMSGQMRDFMLIGPGSGVASAIGIDMGDAIYFEINHVVVMSYNSSGSIGLNINNSINWTERSHIQMFIQDCDTCVVMTNSGSGVYSNEFNEFDFQLQCRVTDDGAPTNQNGVLIHNGNYISKGTLVIRGNWSTSASAQSNYALKITGSAGGFTSHISQSRLEMKCETDNSRANAPIPIAFGTGNSITNCAGVLGFDDGWASATGLTGSVLKFGGPIEDTSGDTGLAAVNNAPTGWA